jgi:6-phosphogluconate dehydrogenase
MCLLLISAFLGDIEKAFERNPDLENLLFDDFFRTALTKCQPSWRLILSETILLGLPTPALSSALSFYDGYRCANLPANLLQAQRDYFGAHTFELLEQPGQFVHVNWTGQGGNTSASNYKA